MSNASHKSSLSEDDLKDSIEHVETANVDELDTIESTRCSNYAWLVSITAGVGGFLFGYDTGIISAILVYLGTDLGHTVNSSEKELITSITSGGAFVGAVAAGLTADRFGRKLGIYNGCILFIIGAIIQATSFSIAQMTVGRLVVGLGVGSAAMIVPVQYLDTRHLLKFGIY
jgi:SP family myo-inositol transporter-like MFS transporter 13